jgi:hypothetical protein
LSSGGLTWFASVAFRRRNRRIESGTNTEDFDRHGGHDLIF